MATEATENKTAIEEVLAAERSRCAAIADDDFATMEALLGDELWYMHANGHCDSKASLIEGLHQGKRSVERDDLEVRIYGDVALVFGGYVVNINPRDGVGASRRIDNNGIQAWIKRDGAWQLIAQLGAAR